MLPVVSNQRCALVVDVGLLLVRLLVALVPAVVAAPRAAPVVAAPPAATAAPPAAAAAVAVLDAGSRADLQKQAVSALQPTGSICHALTSDIRPIAYNSRACETRLLATLTPNSMIWPTPGH